MHPPKCFYLIIVFILLSGCSGAPQQTATLHPPAQRSPVVLPPTWTLTPSLPPSKTPIRPPTQTFTPFPSVTPLPPTLTLGPTSDASTPAATPTITPTIDTGCYLFALEEGVPIQFAPFMDPYRVLPTMSPAITYQADSIHPPYYELSLDDKTLGWVDYRQLTLASKGPGCNQLPTDTRELDQFPHLCFLSADGEVETYTDRALILPFDAITSMLPYVLLLKYNDVFLTSAGEAGPGLFVDIRQVSTFGDCDAVPTTGVTIADGWLWSQPDGENGEQIRPLTPGYRVFIQEGPIEGSRPTSLSEDGAWYLVLVSPPEDRITGWVWSSQIFID